jgi:hypothetical protein
MIASGTTVSGTTGTGAVGRLRLTNILYQAGQAYPKRTGRGAGATSQKVMRPGLSRGVLRDFVGDSREIRDRHAARLPRKTSALKT